MNEGHQRFQDWLTAGAEGDPPRDLAVHASVCSACQQSIAALDQLAVVNTGLAAMPGTPTGRERSRLVMAGRLVGATAVLLIATILGVGASQLIGVSRPGSPVAQATATPGPSSNQGVLGETATPGPSPSGEAAPSAAQETLTPLGTPLPTHAPAVTPIPRRTPAPTPFTTPIATPIPTPIASSSAAPEPTPTPTPTPAPSEPDAPSLSASTGATGEINLSWSTPNDGGDAITSYDVHYASDDSLAVSVAFGTNSLVVSGSLIPGTSYSFYVIARNSIGPSGHSNIATADAGL